MTIQNHKIDGGNVIYLINSYRYEKAEFKTLSGGANQNYQGYLLIFAQEFKTLSGETKGLGHAVL